MFRLLLKLKAIIVISVYMIFELPDHLKKLRRFLYCYANGQVPYKDQCWNEFPFAKKKWTPAEAVKWLKEDDNTVTITFKQ